MLKKFEDILGAVENNPKKKKVALVCAEEIDALHAVMEIWKKGLIIPLLIGNKNKIEDTLNDLGYGNKIDNLHIIDAGNTEEAAELGVEVIKSGAADFLMKGQLETAQLLKAVVDRKKGLSVGRVMSHVAVNEIPAYHKLLMTTDGGMMPYPSLEHKKQIIENVVDMMNDLGYKDPIVCVLAATENINPKMVETTDAAALKEMNKKGEIINCIIEGPISLDLALVKERAKKKNYDSPYAGEADVLIVPNIHAGNIMGKTLVEMAGGKMAGLILGASCPIVLTSRGSSYEEKFNSLMLACLVSGKEN